MKNLQALRFSHWKIGLLLGILTVAPLAPARGQGAITVLVDGRPVSFEGATPLRQDCSCRVASGDFWRTAGVFVGYPATERARRNPTADCQKAPACKDTTACRWR